MNTGCRRSSSRRRCRCSSDAGCLGEQMAHRDRGTRGRPGSTSVTLASSDTLPSSTAEHAAAVNCLVTERQLAQPSARRLVDFFDVRTAVALATSPAVLDTAIETPGNWRVCIDFRTTASSASTWPAPGGSACGCAPAPAGSRSRQQTSGIARPSGRSGRRKGAGVIDRTRRRGWATVPACRQSGARCWLNSG